MSELQDRITEILRDNIPIRRSDCKLGVSDLVLKVTAHELAEAAEQHYRPRIETVEQLDALPDGVVVASSADTFAARFDRVHGVVFGHDQPFRWLSLRLPVRVLWSPGADE